MSFCSLADFGGKVKLMLGSMSSKASDNKGDADDVEYHDDDDETEEKIQIQD
jgi:hypothetical protein